MLHSMRSLHLAIWLLAGYALAAPCILHSTGTGCDIQSRSNKYSASELSAVYVQNESAKAQADCLVYRASKFGSWPGSSSVEKRRERESESESIRIDGNVEEFSESESSIPGGGFNSE